MDIGTTEWIVGHAISALFWLWIWLWGGAEFVEGWKSWFLISWFAANWSAEQIKLYAFWILLIQLVLFVVGLVKPEFRM